MKAAIYPGSFDPLTLGHMDVIIRSANIFDELIVAVLDNKAKSPLFSVAERVKIIDEATKDLPNVKVESFSGLTIDYAKSKEGIVPKFLQYSLTYDLQWVLKEDLSLLGPDEIEKFWNYFNRVLDFIDIDVLENCFYSKSRLG